MKSELTTATLAVIDPELTMTCPEELTAACGVDAVAHSIEAMTGKSRNPVSDALAYNALSRLSKWLPVAVKEPENYEARENVAYAATLAGMAFCNSPLHMGHCCGHSIGAMYHIPHGMSLSFAYPEVAQWLSRFVPDKIRLALEAMNLKAPEGLSDEELGIYAKNALRGFVKDLGLPALKTMVPAGDIEKIAAMCVKDFGVASAPSPDRPTEEDFRNILASAFAAE